MAGGTCGKGRTAAACGRLLARVNARGPVRSTPGNAEVGPPEGDPTSTMFVRRRPTLPQPLGCSTIGAERLNFRVRYGTGCFPFRYGRRNSFNPLKPPHTVSCGLGLLVGNCVVDANSVCSLVARGVHDPCGAHQGWVLGCVVVYVVGTSPRPISTGRLGITAVHLRPINPMFCGGPYPIIGWETSS